MSGFAPLVATGGELAVVYRTAAFLWGRWNANYGEVEAEDFEYGRELGFVGDLDDPPAERGARLWTNVDVSVDADAEFSDVPFVFEQAGKRTEGDKVLDLTIGREGFGEQVPGEDFHLGDVVPVLLGGGKLVDLPVSEIVFGSVPGDAVGVAVRAGGRLLGSASSLSEQNAQLRAQIVRETNELRKKTGSLERVASDAGRVAREALEVARSAGGDAALLEQYIEDARAAVLSASDFAAQAIAAADEADALNVGMAAKLSTVAGYVQDAAGHVADAQASAAQAFAYLDESRVLRESTRVFMEQAEDAVESAQGYVSQAGQIMDEADQVLSSTRQFRDQAQTAMSGARTALNDAKGTLEQVVAKHGEVLTWHQDVLTAHGETLAVHETALALHASGIRAANAAAGQAASAAAANSMVLQVHGQILELHEDAIEFATETALDASAAAESASLAAGAVAAAQEIQVEVNSRLAAGVRAAGVAAAQAAAATSSLALAVEEVDRAAAFAQQTADDAKAVGEKATQIANDAKTASDAAIAAGTARDQTIRDTSDLAALANFRRTRFWYSGNMSGSSTVNFNDTLLFDDGTPIFTISGNNATGWTIETTGNFSGKIAMYSMTTQSYFGTSYFDVPLGSAGSHSVNHTSANAGRVQRLFIHVYPEWPSQAVKDKYTSMQMPYRK